MVTVTLSGPLGEAVGRSVWELAVESVGEAVHAIECQTRKLYAYLQRKESEGVEYRVLINGKDHTGLEDLTVERELRTVEILPVPSGSAGLWQTIVGVVLIIVGVVIAVGTFGTGTFAGVAALQWGMAIIGLGLSVTLGGISQMLAKSPSLSLNPSLNRKFEEKKDEPAAQRPNYLFSGVVNTTRQGNVVPIGYGRMLVGSQLVSFGLTGSPADFQVGSDVPPSDHDPFFDEDFWQAFKDDPRAATVLTNNQIDKYDLVTLQTVSDSFHLRDTNPRLTSTQMRNWLKRARKLFNAPEDLTYMEVRNFNIYLELGEVTTPKGSFKQYCVALAHFYLPGTPTP